MPRTGLWMSVVARRPPASRLFGEGTARTTPASERCPEWLLPPLQVSGTLRTRRGRPRAHAAPGELTAYSCHRRKSRQRASVAGNRLDDGDLLCRLIEPTKLNESGGVADRQSSSPGSRVGPIWRLCNRADRATISSGSPRQKATCTAVCSQTASVAGSSSAVAPRAASRCCWASSHLPRPAATLTTAVCRKPWIQTWPCPRPETCLGRHGERTGPSSQAVLHLGQDTSRDESVRGDVTSHLTLSAPRSARAPARSSTTVRSAPRVHS